MLMQGQQVEICYMGIEGAKNAIKKLWTSLRTPAQVLLDYYMIEYFKYWHTKKSKPKFLHITTMKYSISVKVIYYNFVHTCR